MTSPVWSFDKKYLVHGLHYEMIITVAWREGEFTQSEYFLLGKSGI